MDASDIPISSAGDKQAHQRISKACQECRRRKIKCDGAPTCKNCEQISAACTYRSTARNRKLTRRAAVARQQQQPSSFIESQRCSDTPPIFLSHRDQLPLTESQEGRERARRVEEDISNSQSSVFQTQDDQPGTAGTNRSISATHVASPSCILQLYYGASSNFSFLQQIHFSLSGSANPLRPRGEVEEGGAGLDLYGQRSLFFGMSDGSHLPNGLGGISPLTFLSDQLAESFLEHYLNTLYHLHPFQPSHELRRLLKLLYDKPQTSDLSTDETTVLISILAIGATMTKDTAWAEMLAEKAKNIANTLGHVCILGRPNSAYLYLGVAVRKAFAAGLHRDTPTSDTDGRKQTQQQERRTTIWCLYFHESLICFALGRPSSIARVDISSPYPDNQPFISALIKLTNVMSEAAESIYAYRQFSLQDLYRKAQKIHRELQDYALDVQERFGISLSQSAVSTELGTKHIFLQNLYYHIFAITFRPFLIADVEHQKSTTKIGNPSIASTQNGRSLVERFPWMSEACKYAVDAAFNLIRFIYTAIEQNVMTRGLKFFAFYIEGACFLLIYDVLRDNSAKDQNVSAVKIGLKCLEAMISGGGTIASNIFSIQRLLDALDEIPLNVGSRVDDSASVHLNRLPSQLGNFDFVPAAPGNLSNGSVAPGYPFDTLVNFAAGWATFKDGHYMSQNAVPEPERFNPDLCNLDWEFDNISNVPGAPF